MSQCKSTIGATNARIIGIVRALSPRDEIHVLQSDQSILPGALKATPKEAFKQGGSPDGTGLPRIGDRATSLYNRLTQGHDSNISTVGLGEDPHTSRGKDGYNSLQHILKSKKEDLTTLRVELEENQYTHLTRSQLQLIRHQSTAHNVKTTVRSSRIKTTNGPAYNQDNKKFVTRERSINTTLPSTPSVRRSSSIRKAQDEDKLDPSQPAPSKLSQHTRKRPAATQISEQLSLQLETPVAKRPLTESISTSSLPTPPTSPPNPMSTQQKKSGGNRKDKGNCGDIQAPSISTLTSTSKFLMEPSSSFTTIARKRFVIENNTSRGPTNNRNSSKRQSKSIAERIAYAFVEDPFTPSTMTTPQEIWERRYNTPAQAAERGMARTAPAANLGPPAHFAAHQTPSSGASIANFPTLAPSLAASALTTAASAMVSKQKEMKGLQQIIRQ
ncbi:uncharacterized protein BP5553_10583 [Venustampulla echinocandica]|uniref:Uncharacterized protein n=1 Tax=Venustampulla echinocandica TaxID=2656787 RepID=A0A370T8Z3_9HELO|nr:uncharacterized protein BP5553_10583 [Venustampulla echinocandica]RDL29956.1 hypothetical protein BP5553_10583 [Venustampulla echinocandica]